MRVLTICYCVLTITACSGGAIQPTDLENMIGTNLALVDMRKDTSEFRGAVFEPEQKQDIAIAPISVMGPDWHAVPLAKETSKESVIDRSLEKPQPEKRALAPAATISLKPFMAELELAEISEDQVTSMATFH
jgi:hypothetical protein